MTTDPPAAVAPVMLPALAIVPRMAPPDALLALYRHLPGATVNTCEQHRRGMLRDAAAHLRAIRDALPVGEFGPWLDAAGINRRTAASIIRRFEQRQANSMQQSLPAPGGGGDEAGEPAYRTSASMSLIVSRAPMVSRGSGGPGVMRIAYADPPYPGLAHYYRKYDPDAAEEDHAELLARLDRDFDGWALSTSSTALPGVLALCPPGVRVGAWVRKAIRLKRGVYPTYAWEPVIFRPAPRPQPPGALLDWLLADVYTGVMPPDRHLIGRKPDKLCFWIFDLLRAKAGDTFVDLYPGSGAALRAWDAWCDQAALAGDAADAMAGGTS